MPSFLPDHIRRGVNRARPESERLIMGSEWNPACNEPVRGEMTRFAFSFCQKQDGIHPPTSAFLDKLR
jgi:hypothetical protein